MEKSNTEYNVSRFDSKYKFGTPKDIAFIRERSIGQTACDFTRENKDGEYYFSKEGECFDPIFLITLYNYFIGKELPFNKTNIENAFSEIDSIYITKPNINFISNENGFFVQIRSLSQSSQKMEAFGSLSYNNENKEFILKNSQSEISLYQDGENDKILRMNVKYPNFQTKIEMLNFKENNELHTIGININYFKSSDPMYTIQPDFITSGTFGINYNFETDKSGKKSMNFNRIEKYNHEKKTDVRIEQIYLLEKEKMGERIDSILTNLDVKFEGKILKNNKTKRMSV